MKDKLIYIAHTRIPSEMANSYQTMQMCHSFSKIYDEVELWVPELRNSEELSQVQDIFEYYSIPSNFNINFFFTIDSLLMHDMNSFIWANTKSFIFGVNMVFQVFNLKDPSISIFTRDWHALKLLVFGKKIGLIKNQIFYEAHKFSNHLVSDIKYIDGLIVINNFLKKIHQEKGINNILVAHDGVNIDEYKYVSDYKYVQDNNIYNLVYTGNLFKWKGVYTLVDSLEFITKKCKLIIIGGSPIVLNNLKKYIKNKNIYNVELTGFFPKKHTIQYVNKADILFLPNSAKDKMSFYTSPIKLFEYMAAKRPIIASNIPSICEILENKKNSILFEPDNSKDLADKINWVLENDCNDIVNQAFDDVQEYTWDIRARKIKEFIYKDKNV
jgi:glycosyltransferase involved in cell wall biosynthesis